MARFVEEMHGARLEADAGPLPDREPSVRPVRPVHHHPEVLVAVEEMDEGLRPHRLHEVDPPRDGRVLRLGHELARPRADAQGDAASRGEAGPPGHRKPHLLPAQLEPEGALARLDQGGFDEVHARRPDEAGHEQVGGLGEDAVRGVDLLDDPVPHDRDAVRHGERLELVVGDDHGGLAEPGEQLLDLPPHHLALLDVEPAQGLVEQEAARVADDRTPDRRPLLLPLRELAGQAPEHGGQMEEGRDPVHPLLDLRLRYPLVVERVGEVLGDGEDRVEGVELEHHRDVALRRAKMVDPPLRDEDVALGRVLEPRDHAKGRRLPAAGGAEQAQHLPRLHVEVGAVHRHQRAEPLGDVAKADGGHGSLPRSSPLLPFPRRALAPDGPEGDPAQQVVLQDVDHHHHRDQEQGLDGREQTPPHPDVAADGLRHRDRDGAGLHPGEEQGEQELVPGEDEAEHGGGREPRLDLGHADPEEDPVPVAAVETRRVLHLGRELVEEALHHPDGEREVERGVEQDHAEVGPAQPAHPEHEEDRDDHHDRGQHAGGEDDEEVGRVPLEGVAREPVGGEGPDDEGDQHRRARDEHRVEEIDVEVGVDRRLPLDVGAGEHAHEVLEGGGEDPLGRDRERVGVRLEGGQDDPQHREEVDEADDARERGPPPSRMSEPAAAPHAGASSSFSRCCTK